MQLKVLDCPYVDCGESIVPEIYDGPIRTVCITCPNCHRMIIRSSSKVDPQFRTKGEYESTSEPWPDGPCPEGLSYAEHQRRQNLKARSNEIASKPEPQQDHPDDDLDYTYYDDSKTG